MTQPPHQPGQLPDDSPAPQAMQGEPPVSAQSGPQTPPATPAAQPADTPAAPDAPAVPDAPAAPGVPAPRPADTPAAPAPDAPPPGGTTPQFPGAPGAYPEAPPAPAKKSRKGLVIGIVAGVLTLLVGGGVAAAVLVMRNADAGRGTETAGEAVNEFMRAAYRDRDSARTAELVCGRAQDRQRLDAKISEIEELVSASPGLFSWSEPTVIEESEQTATVTTTVKLATNDERLSTLDLRFVVVQNERWLVCEVS